MEDISLEKVRIGMMSNDIKDLNQQVKQLKDYHTKILNEFDILKSNLDDKIYPNELLEKITSQFLECKNFINKIEDNYSSIIDIMNKFYSMS